MPDDPNELVGRYFHSTSGKAFLHDEEDWYD